MKNILGGTIGVFGILLMQACGVGAQSSSYDTTADYINYDIYEYDDFRKTKTWLTTDCINLDRSWEDGRVSIENRYSDELEFSWSMRDDRIEFRIDDGLRLVSKMRYDTDFFRNGSSVEHKVVPTFGETFLISLSGPDCNSH